MFSSNKQDKLATTTKIKMPHKNTMPTIQRQWLEYMAGGKNNVEMSFAA